MNQIIHEKVLQEFMRCAYETVNFWVAKHTFPISIKNKARFDLYGSSVGVHIAGEKYIATAKHLIDELAKTDGDAYVHTEVGAFLLNNRNMIFPKDNNIDYDICLIKMTSEFENVPTIPHWNFYVGDKLFTSNFEYIQGYPINKNKARKIGDVGFGYFSDQIKFDQNIDPDMIGVSAKTHWIFRHNGGLYGKDPKNLQQSGPNNMPSLKGLSGCGMWCLSNVNDISSIKLAGIFTTHGRGIGVGTKIKYLQQLVLQV